jgi:hypothetical protein
VSAPESLAPSFDSDTPRSPVPDDCEDGEEEDVWAFAQERRASSQVRNLPSWDRFYDHSFVEPPTYISEAGPAVFDTVLQFQHNVFPQESKPMVFKLDPVMKALQQLGLGMESIFFKFEHENRRFLSRIPAFTISGFSRESTDSLIAIFAASGDTVRSLGSFAANIYESKNSCKTMVSLAETISTALTHLDAYIVNSIPAPQSVLQLNFLFENPRRILSMINSIVTSLPQGKTNETILSAIYKLAGNLECADAWIRPVILEFLAHLSKPWLEDVCYSIGLRNNGTWAENLGHIPLFFEQSAGLQDDESLYTAQMPVFLSQKDRETVVQTHKSLKLIEAHMRDHVLVNTSHGEHIEAPRLDWCFGWADVERIQAKANHYEANLLQVMRTSKGVFQRDRSVSLNRTTGNSYLVDPFGSSTDVMESQIRRSYSIFEGLPPNQPFPGTEGLVGALAQALQPLSSDKVLDVSFDPPLSLAPVISFAPIIMAQARLVNLACLQMLLKDHHLRSHLSLHRRYYLFGDGVFASRLAQALFNPHLESAERRKGHARTGTMGLRLGYRDTWPPASSELRLALMGILSESYHGTLRSTVSAERELPGGLSFAIRDITEEEIQKCLDPHSVEALDFLCLQYKPPAPLNAVITSSSLLKYDSIFKLLLRMTRMLFVVNDLSSRAIDRSAQAVRIDPLAARFRIEAHHFITTLCGYFFDVCVGATWDRFEAALGSIERKLDNLDGARLHESEGLHRLQMMHEHTLDAMMFALLLRRRQEQVMKLLLEIFELILSYARHANAPPDGDGAPPASHIRSLYRDLRQKIEVFVTVCRGLSENPEYGSGKSGASPFTNGLFAAPGTADDGTAAMGQLLLRLEMNGYYSQPVRI